MPPTPTIVETPSPPAPLDDLHEAIPNVSADLCTKEPIAIAEHLHVQLFEFPIDDVGGVQQSLQVTLTGLPFSDTGASVAITGASNDPTELMLAAQIKTRDDAIMALAKCATLALETREIELDLAIRPFEQAAIPVEDPSSSTSSPDIPPPVDIREWLQASELNTTFPYSTGFATILPANLIGLLGLQILQSDVADNDSTYFSQLLAILQASRIKFSTTPYSSHTSSLPSNRFPYDPLQPFIYTPGLPLAGAGNAYFNKVDHTLNYLEIGPQIPITDHSTVLSQEPANPEGDKVKKYWFPFVDWHIRVLAIRYIPASQQEGHTTEAIIPKILYDPKFGLERMLKGKSKKLLSKSEERVATRVILIVDSDDIAAGFAKNIKKIVKSDMQAEKKVAEASKRRYKLFKQMMYYVCPMQGADVKKIWNGEDKAKVIEGAPLAEQDAYDGIEPDGNVIDLPPLQAGEAASADPGGLEPDDVPQSNEEIGQKKKKKRRE